MENKYPMLKQLFAISALACLSASPLVAQGTQQPPRLEGVTANEPQDRAQNQPLQQPLTQEELYNLIKKNKKDLDVVYKALDEHGVNFDLDRKIEAKMRSVGADDNLLQAIWKAGPTGRNEKTATLTSSSGVPLHAKYEEAMGYKTMEDELDPDKRLRMVEEFEHRFPTSELMSTVYTQAAKSYREKGDLNKLVEYGEKSLKLDANNLYSLLMVAIALPQPRMVESNPELSAQRLSTAEEYANRALKLIDGVPARPNETGEQLKKRKDVLASDAHAALGMVYMDRDESPKAVEELKTAVSLTQTPNPQLYFRLGEVYENEGKNNEAVEAFTKASELGHGTVLQQYADQRIAKLKKK
jgi:tetratricopeptide (TPR) repeat protein